MTESGYPPDLTAPQWELLHPLLPTANGGCRPPADRRRVLNGVLYLTRAGCAWRLLPHDFGPWQMVYGHFRTWKRTHHWEILPDTRRDYVRAEAGQRTQPTARCSPARPSGRPTVPGRGVMTEPKKITGRKRVPHPVDWRPDRSD